MLINYPWSETKPPVQYWGKDYTSIGVPFLFREVGI
jgi:hypothetical protein